MSFFRDLQESLPTQQPAGEGNPETAVDSAFAQLEADERATHSANVEEIETLSEVEVRLRKANYYRAILDNRLFDSDASALAEDVEREFRDFALERLRVLLGMASEPAKQAILSDFDEDEVKVLKLWASKLLQRPAVMSIEPTQPKVRQATVNEAPAQTVQPKVKPVVAPPQAPKRGPGRPPGTGKHQRALSRVEDKPQPQTATSIAAPAVHAPTAEVEMVNGHPVKIDANGRRFIEVVKEVDGKPKAFKLDVSKPVQPPPTAPQPKPMPSEDAAIRMESQNADIIQNRLDGARSELVNRVLR